MKEHTMAKAWNDSIEDEVAAHETQQKRNWCVETRIQGRPVTLIRCDGRTQFTFHPTGEAGELSEAQFLASYGSQDPDFVYGLMRQLASVGSSANGGPDAPSFELALAAVRGMAPRNPMEAELRAQMVVIHSTMMKVANRLAEAEEGAEIESLERSLNRLSRTYCSLAEAFDRHRNGDRKIAVQQVSIAEGAQAIIGDVHHTGAQARRHLNGQTSHAKLRRKFNDHAKGAKAPRGRNGHASA
jgi:hypothetical protein